MDRRLGASGVRRIEVRPTVADDLPHFFEDPLPWRIRAMTGVVNGEPVGIGGVAFPPGGGVLAFAAFDDEARRFPVAMHRAGLRLMRELREAGVTSVRTLPEANIAAAERWLERLGFRPTDRIDDMVIWTWHSSRS